MSSTRHRIGKANRVVAQLVYLACIGALTSLTLTTFRALQLPRWSAWIVAIVVGVALAAALMSLAKRGKAYLNGCLIGLLAATAATLVLSEQHFAASAARSMAFAHPLIVLPFEGAPGSRFAAQLYEHVLESLREVEGLDVISAAGAKPLPPDVAAAVGEPTAVMLGASASYEAGRLRSALRIVDGGTGNALWSSEYDASFDALATIDLELAAAVAELQSLLLAESLPSRLEQRRPGSIELFDLYGRVAAAWRMGGPVETSLMEPLQLLERALELDAGFGPAHALAANLEAALPLRGGGGPSARSSAADNIERVERYAEAALMTGPGNARAYQALAKSAQHRWQSGRAGELYELALQRGSTDPWLLMDYAMFSAWTRHREQAIESAERAVRLAPFNAALRAQLGRAYYFCGSYDSAVAAYGEAAELGSTSPRIHLWRAMGEALRGEPALARDALEEYERLRVGVTHLDAQAAYVYAMLDLPEDAVRLVDTLERATASQAVGSATRAVAKMATGEYLEALDWLGDAASARILDEGWEYLMEIAANSWSDPVLNEPAFRELREALRLQ